MNRIKYSFIELSTGERLDWRKRNTCGKEYEQLTDENKAKATLGTTHENGLKTEFIFQK